MLEAGNIIITLDDTEVAAWKAAAQLVVARLIAARKADGIDGQALIDRAKALNAENREC